MDKELCLKFLVHLHKCATAVLQKPHIDAIDITYLNNEVDNFHRRVDRSRSAAYDPNHALGAIARIKEESAGDKALNVSKFLLKAKYKWLAIFFGDKDDAHAQREAKVADFREKVKKVLVVVEYSG